MCISKTSVHELVIISNCCQCVNLLLMCDDVPDCDDVSDEMLCGRYRNEIDNSMVHPPPALIEFYAHGAAFVRPLNSSGVNGSSVCPETHFQCPDNGYCLPVFVLCNGVYDCPGHEDEADCDSYKCPGFYRCRGSTVCVHARQLCDGVYQCPQRDDEWLCWKPQGPIYTCPRNCTCYGLAFVCRGFFPVNKHSELRYLKANGSGLNYADVGRNLLLTYLDLSKCNITDLVQLNLPNLLSLDLSHNHLTSVADHHLRGLVNLRHLTLANNPLTSVFKQRVVSSASFPNLRTLDLSGVSLPEMDVSALSVFPSLNTLNLSHCGVDRVLGDGFQALQQLRVLDLRSCPLTIFPRGVFDGLDDLQAVFADNYKLCCPATLPLRFNPANCKAPSDEISSCQSLLRSDLYRIFLSIFAVSAFVGNLISVFVRLFVTKINQKMGFAVFVANLCISDFLMGLYLVLIGVADRHYMGTYLWNDVIWRNSAACKTAGFLSLLSSEVSAFIICLITLDRLLVLRFPFSHLRFNRTKAVMVSALVWTAGLVIAVVPLLPWTSHWRFFSQTGICIPLPVTRKDFAGRSYAFSVMIVLNFALFMLIALGQLLIYHSVQKNKMRNNDITAKCSRDLTLAHRLITVAVSDFLCWFPIGVLGLMASAGTPIPSEVNVALAIFVLPLNSAINPFLYTLNMLLERRRQRRDERFKQLLLSQMQAHDTDSDRVARLCSCTQEEALRISKQWLKEGILSAENVSRCLVKTESTNRKPSIAPFDS